MHFQSLIWPAVALDQQPKTTLASRNKLPTLGQNSRIFNSVNCYPETIEVKNKHKKKDCNVQSHEETKEITILPAEYYI